MSKSFGVHIPPLSLPGMGMSLWTYNEVGTRIYNLLKNIGHTHSQHVQGFIHKTLPRVLVFLVCDGVMHILNRLWLGATRVHCLPSVLSSAITKAIGDIKLGAHNRSKQAGPLLHNGSVYNNSGCIVRVSVDPTSNGHASVSTHLALLVLPAYLPGRTGNQLITCSLDITTTVQLRLCKTHCFLSPYILLILKIYLLSYTIFRQKSVIGFNLRLIFWCNRSFDHS